MRIAGVGDEAELSPSGRDTHPAKQIGPARVGVQPIETRRDLDGTHLRRPFFVSAFEPSERCIHVAEGGVSLRHGTGGR